MDLSPVSMNAFDYAINKYPGASITALHVITSMIDVDYPLHHTSAVSNKDRYVFDIEEMIRVHLDVAQLPLQITVDAVYGEPVAMITKYLDKHLFDLVFLGSRDNYNLLEKVLGTVSLGVVKTSKVPVFVIPKFARFHEYQKIVVACDEHVNDPDIVMQLNYWNTTNAQMKFIHVTTDDSSDTQEKIKGVLLTQLYEEYQLLFPYEVETINSTNISGSLLATAYNYKAGLLITIARNTSFLYSLIYKSLSKDLLIKSAIPMLFLHANNKI